MTVSDDLRRRMHHENRALRVLQDDLLEAFEDFCDDPGAKSQASLVKIFHDFSASMRRHFDFEEVGGYMTEVMRRRPHHQVEVNRLRAEHKDLNTMLDQLENDFRHHLYEDGSALQRTKKDFVGMLRRLGRHEQAERELILDVFWLEGGGSE